MIYKLVILTLIMFRIALAEDQDPKSFDICMLLSDGKTQILKNKNNEVIDTERLLETLRITKNEDGIVLIKKGATQTLYIKDEKITYRIRVIGNHYAFYEISVKDFIDYVSGGDDWKFMPGYYSDIKRNETLKLVPHEK